MAELLERKRTDFTFKNSTAASKSEDDKLINRLRPGSFQWKICIPDLFDNCERIYPFQQWKVAELISDLKQDQNVKKVIVFGSSVTDRCHAGSDVDVFVELKEDRRVLHRSYDFLFDLWTNFTVDERMKKEIEKKGVVVYEQ